MLFINVSLHVTVSMPSYRKELQKCNPKKFFFLANDQYWELKDCRDKYVTRLPYYFVARMQVYFIRKYNKKWDVQLYM